MGEGWGGGWRSEMTVAPPANNCTTPTPNPSPQGGGERTEIAALLCSSINELPLVCRFQFFGFGGMGDVGDDAGHGDVAAGIESDLPAAEHGDDGVAEADDLLQVA